jgi:hypothetical protein
MKDWMRKVLYSAVIMLVSFAPSARAQARRLVLTPAPMVIQMPEVANTAILATDLLSVGILIFVFRRRAPRTNR